MKLAIFAHPEAEGLILGEHLLPHASELVIGVGLPLEAVQRYRLGYNPGEKGKSCLIRPRASWGLPPAKEEGWARMAF